MVNTDF